MDNFSDAISQILSNPESLEKIKSIAGSLMGGNAEEKQDDCADCHSETPAASPDLSSLLAGGLPGGIDPKLLARLLRAYSCAGNIDDSRLALLYALKPYLSKSRCDKIDTAVNMLRLSKAAKAFFDDNDT